MGICSYALVSITIQASSLVMIQYDRQMIIFNSTQVAIAVETLQYIRT